MNRTQEIASNSELAEQIVRVIFFDFFETDEISAEQMAVAVASLDQVSDYLKSQLRKHGHEMEFLRTETLS